jgi:FixJ family two-component response regulator
MMNRIPSEPLRPIVHVVEDEESNREATARLLRAAGHAVRSYRSADEFLATWPRSATGCVVLDLRMPGRSGLELQRAIVEADDPLPIVFLSGQADVPDSVQAMKSGAIDLLGKSVDGSVLLEAVSRALASDVEGRAARARRRETLARYHQLTPREREVFAHLISGQLNKQIGFDLGISERTTKIHRRQVLEKMHADSIADLVRMSAEIGIAPAGTVR